MKIFHILLSTIAMALIAEGEALAQGKYVSCPWSDGTDYSVYEIDDEGERFRFMTTYDYGTDALSKVPHKENENFKEYIDTFSTQRIYHCRLNKKKDQELCYDLNRVNGTLTKSRNGEVYSTTSCSVGLPASKF